MGRMFLFDAPSPGDRETLRALLGGHGAGFSHIAFNLNLPVPPRVHITHNPV